MSLRFKGDEFEESEAREGEKAAVENGITYYKTPGHIRNLRVVKLDGTSYFFNYAYFGAVRYSPEKSYVTFQAQGYDVYIKGYGLEELFLCLHNQLPMEIKCLDPRYLVEDNLPKVGVTEISVISTKWKKKKAKEESSSKTE